MKGFYIEITNNLLEPKHIKAMGSAIWEFMWCLDKITRTDENGVGWVYGGKPIKRESIRQELGKNISHISENLNKLKDAGYLTITRTPHGLVIGVNKAKKRYSQKATPEIAKRQHQKSEKATSNIRQDTRQDIRQEKEKRKEKEVVVLTHNSPPHQKYSNLDGLSEEDFQEIAQKYQVPISFVRSKFDDMVLWAGERPNNAKLRDRNWRITLMRWVKTDAFKIRERSKGDPTKRAIDARHL